MKRIIALVLTVGTLLLMVAGCGSDNRDYDCEDAPINSTWVLDEMTINGKTTTNKNDLEDETAPQFLVYEGNEFVFKINGDMHFGTLTSEDGVYTLNYDDTDNIMEARITGNVLSITIPGTGTEMIFVADEESK